MRISGKLIAVALSALCVTGVSACSGDGNDPGPTEQAELSPADRLAAAKTKLDATPSVHLALTSADLPKEQSGLISGDGWGKHPPAFKGTFKINVQGVQADAEIIAIGTDVWAKLPLIPGMNKIDPANFGLPNPANFFSPDKGLTTLLTSAASPTEGAEVRKGAEVLTTITGTVPGSVVVDLLKLGDANGTFDATYSLTDAHELREAQLTGPFYGANTTSTYTLTLDQYGVPVTIEQP